MKVSDLMIRDVHCCHPGDPMSRAAQIMWEQDCGAVPVVDGLGRLVGMITDRDVAMAAYTDGRPLTALEVARAMAAEPVSCAPGDAAEDVLATMARAQVHRLPVVGPDGEVVGILSVSDLVQKGGGRSKAAWNASLVDALSALRRPRGAEVAVLTPKPRAKAPGRKATPRKAAARKAAPRPKAAPKKKKASSRR